MADEELVKKFVELQSQAEQLLNDDKISEAKQKYLEDGNQDWVGVLQNNPLPASLNFKVRSEYAVTDSLQKIQADLGQNIAVSDVQYPQSLVSNLNNIIRKISLIL